jgi:hypothetical protein
VLELVATLLQLGWVVSELPLSLFTKPVKPGVIVGGVLPNIIEGLEAVTMSGAGLTVKSFDVFVY